MSIFNKIFASVGFGGVKIDTKLENEWFTAGDKVRGTVEIKGGTVHQHIDGIYMSLMTTYIQEIDDNKVERKAVVGKFRLTGTFDVEPNETKSYPFEFEVPLDVPITAGKTRIWVQTGADIKLAIDPTDRDFIEVIPNPLMASFLKSIEELGFLLRKAECVHTKKLTRRLPFLQEFEFVPVKGEFVGKMDELEIIFLSSFERQLEVFLEIDKKGKGLGGLLSEALDLDESTIKLTVMKQDEARMTEKIRKTLFQFI